MSMRIVKSARRTDETEISLTLNLDGSGIYDVDTGCGILYLNHDDAATNRKLFRGSPRFPPIPCRRFLPWR